MLAKCTCDPSLRPKQHTATRWFTLVRRSLLPATPNHTQLKQLYLLHRHCICCTGTVSAAQALYLLHRHCVLLHRHCICCTGTASAAQALCSAAWALYLLHRHCLCCTGTVSPAQALCSAAQALYLLYRHCSKNLFKKTVHRISSTNIFSASLYSVWLDSVHSTPCMYMHGFTLVYIHILTAGFGNFGNFGDFASLGGPRLLGGGDAHGMRRGAAYIYIYSMFSMWFSRGSRPSRPSAARAPKSAWGWECARMRTGTD